MSKISGNFLLIVPPGGLEVVSGDMLIGYISNDLTSNEESRKNQLETLEKFSGVSSVGDFLGVFADGERAIVVRLGKKLFTVVEKNKESQPEGKKT